MQAPRMPGKWPGAASEVRMKAIALGARVALATVLLVARARAELLVVAPMGGDHTNIQAAVDAAHDGDVILVKSGVYPGFGILERELVVAADLGAQVFITSTISVQFLRSDQDVLLQGLQQTESQSHHGLFANRCKGSLRIQDCLVR